MAYISMITNPRTFTAAESEALTTYCTAQVTAGTTNNTVYTWLTNADPSMPQNVRIWSTSESAAGYQSIIAGFSPAVTVAVF